VVLQFLADSLGIVERPPVTETTALPAYLAGMQAGSSAADAMKRTAGRGAAEPRMAEANAPAATAAMP
jgi:glycerol kinase